MLLCYKHQGSRIATPGVYIRYTKCLVPVVMVRPSFFAFALIVFAVFVPVVIVTFFIVSVVISTSLFVLFSRSWSISFSWGVRRNISCGTDYSAVSINDPAIPGYHHLVISSTLRIIWIRVLTRIRIRIPARTRIRILTWIRIRIATATDNCCGGRNNQK